MHKILLKNHFYYSLKTDLKYKDANMKTAIIFLLMLSFSMVMHAESLELLKAKYDTDVSKRKTQVEAAVYQRIIGKKGIMFDAAEYYETNLAGKRYYKKKKEAEAHVNKLRGEKKTNTLEYYKALNDFYTFQKMEYKELSSNLETKWYDSVSYIAKEGLKGSWGDAKLVVGEVWEKKWDLLKTLLDKGVGEAVKALIYETIDATYKVRFVDYVMHNQSATKKIAEYWWDHFIMGNFKKSKTMEIIEDVVGKGQEKIQEKLEEKVKERVKDELIKKGEQLAKDELEKKTKAAAEGFIRNLITVPSILIECASKYYNVIDFNLMFLKAAPNESNYLNNEIRRVLKELGKLNNDEINKCYFNSDYFMSLRKQVGGKKNPPKFQKEETPKKTKSKIKTKVKSNLQPEVETAWEYYELEEKVTEQAKKITEQAQPAFDVKPFIDLLNAARDELKADAIDHSGFKRKALQVKGLFTRSLDGWVNALVGKAIKEGKSFTPEEVKNRKTPYSTTFNRSYDTVVTEIDEELGQYLQQLKDAGQINLESELKALNQTITSKIESFNSEVVVRSKALVGTEYLAPSKDRGVSKSISDLLSVSGSIRYCFFYKAIFKPNSSTGQYYLGSAKKGHISNSVIILMAGEWFSKSLYDIWYAGYHKSMQLKSRIDEKWQDLYALLNPEKELWRVYYIDKNEDSVYLKDVAAVVNSFRSRSKLKAINDIYTEYSQYTGFVHNLLKKNETGIEISLARFDRYKERLEALLAEYKQAFDWMNIDAKALSTKNFDDWKAMSRSGAELVFRLISNEIPIDEFKKESLLLMGKRDKILANQHYVKGMAGIEKRLAHILKGQQTGIFLQLSSIYFQYLTKYTVPEKAAFQQLAPFSGQIEATLKEKVTTEFSRDRIDKLNKENPGYCTKDLFFDFRKCNISFEQREFSRLFIWEISYGLVENLDKLGKIYEKAIDAHKQVNQWLDKEYNTFYKRADAAQKKKITVEEYQEMSGKFSSITIEARDKFWELVKPYARYVSVKYSEENIAIMTKVNKVLFNISRSFQ